MATSAKHPLFRAMGGMSANFEPRLHPQTWTQASNEATSDNANTTETIQHLNNATASHQATSQRSHPRSYSNTHPTPSTPSAPHTSSSAPVANAHRSKTATDSPAEYPHTADYENCTPHPSPFSPTAWHPDCLADTSPYPRQRHANSDPSSLLATAIPYYPNGSSGSATAYRDAACDGLHSQRRTHLVPRPSSRL